MVGHGEASARRKIAELFVRDAEFFLGVLVEGHDETDLIAELHIFWLLHGASVEIDDVVFDFKHLSRESHAALHVILAAVNGARDDVAKFLWHLPHHEASQGIAAGIFLTLLGERGLWRELSVGAVLHLRPDAQLIDHSVIVLLRMFRSDGVARRIIEDHNVAELHFAQSLHASVVPMRPFKIAARTSDRHGVLRQRHGERRLRDARSVGEFGNEEIVARQQCFLQRRRRNHEVLEEKLVEEIDGNEGKDDGVDPAHHEADGAVLGVFPPSPVDKFAHVDVVDKRHDEESPPRANPIEEEEVESEHDAELDVTASAGRYILEKHVVDCGLFFQESAK